jgi:hypothetical protein
LGAPEVAIRRLEAERPMAAVGRARRRMMAKGQKRSSKEIRKPKAEKPKKNASNPSTKGMIDSTKR